MNNFERGVLGLSNIVIFLFNIGSIFLNDMYMVFLFFSICLIGYFDEKIGKYWYVVFFIV